ncbi:MAG: hypothetical protein AB1589_08830 [Cyanobacteriota bacterium]
MTLNKHDVALIRDLKHQSNTLIFIYIFVGLSGLILSLILDINPYLKIFLAFLAGFLIGISGEKLVTRRIRKIAFDLLDRQRQE